MMQQLMQMLQSNPQLMQMLQQRGGQPGMGQGGMSPQPGMGMGQGQGMNQMGGQGLQQLMEMLRRRQMMGGMGRMNQPGGMGMTQPPQMPMGGMQQTTPEMLSSGQVAPQQFAPKMPGGY